MSDLFSDHATPEGTEALADGAMVLRGFVADDTGVLDAVAAITAQAPFRHLVTRGGFRMSVAMTNCGELGWFSDRRGYRYTSIDPDSGRPWPAIPPVLLQLAHDAAERAGYAGFKPDACLINRYVVGARMTLHQDRDEGNLDAPIVSVSLGIPAVFQFGGFERTGPTVRTPLFHRDVVVWGGPSRLRFHGVLPLKTASHALTGECRINLTFRAAK
jgi:alkylated DNA repair protein (DNA oxidative demethylase)